MQNKCFSENVLFFIRWLSWLPHGIMKSFVFDIFVEDSSVFFFPMKSYQLYANACNMAANIHPAMTSSQERCGSPCQEPNFLSWVTFFAESVALVLHRWHDSNLLFGFKYLIASTMQWCHQPNSTGNSAMQWDAQYKQVKLAQGLTTKLMSAAVQPDADAGLMSSGNITCNNDMAQEGQWNNLWESLPCNRDMSNLSLNMTFYCTVVLEVVKSTLSNRQKSYKSSLECWRGPEEGEQGGI